MKKSLAIIAVALFALTANISCSKKKVEQKVEDLVLKIMTDGTWIVTSYKEGNNDITSSFAGWECQFYPDKTCEARNGTTKIQGTWDASTSAQTFTGQFPSPVDPLTKLTGTWKIVKTNYTYGQFSQTRQGVDCVLDLTKK